MARMKKTGQRQSQPRNAPHDADKPTIEEANVPKSENPSELDRLRKKVKGLEAENRELRSQVTTLQQQLQTREPSVDEQRREQQHNFFKYSNVRRY